MKTLRGHEENRNISGKLHILMLEDSPLDAELVEARLSEGGIDCELTRVQSRDAFVTALEENRIELILADYSLPGFDGLSALEIARKVRPRVPFILISGTLGEEVAIETLKGGATDYVLKHRLQRLLPAVQRAIREAEERRERERAEEALQRSEEEYRAMFELASVGKAQADLSMGRFLRVNAKLCRITGYSEPELLSMTFAELTHPEDREANLARFLAMTRGEASEYSVEERYVRKDGGIIWVGVDAALIRDDSGRPLGVVATMQDITERKRTEEVLARLASFPRLSPTPIIEATVAAEPTYVNPAARELFPDLITLGHRHPILADLATVDREYGWQSVTNEVWVDGVLYQRMISGVPESGLLRIYAIDMSERHRAEEALRESEDRFRGIFEQEAVGFAQVGLDGRWLRVNGKLCEITGYSRAALLDKTFQEITYYEDLDADLEQLRRLLSGQVDTSSIEKRYVRKDGSLIWVQLTVSLMRDEAQAPKYFVSVVEDISKRRRAEKALRDSEELYRAVVEQAAENIFVVDLESKRLLEANVALQRSLGYTFEELKDLALYDIVDRDRDSIDETTQHIVAEGHYLVGQRTYRRKDGSLVDVEVNASMIPYGDRRAMCIVAHDVTEHKRVETALRQSLSVLLALREAGQVLSSTLESEEIVSRLLEIMRSVAGLTAAVVSKRDQEGELHVWRSAGLEDLWPRIRFAQEAERAREGALANEEQKPFRLRRPGSQDEYLVGLCIPLSARNRVVGVLEAYGRESLAQSDMIEIISSLASQSASALENASLYEKLGDRERALQELVQKLLGAQEDERRRVAYEVHDGLAQVAVAAHQNLQAFARRHAPEAEKGKRELDRILGQVRATVSDARRVIANLRPTALDDLGLAAAISLEIERLSEEGYKIDYEERLGDERLPGEMEITLFRVAQEALTNMRKHAETQWVRIELRRREDEVYLEVRDFGRGFDPAALETLGGGPGERVGFAGMRERISMLGGKLEIQSQPNAGTSVIATVPLERIT